MNFLTIRGPFRRGMSRNTEMQNPTPIMRQRQDDIQDLEPDGRHDEKVH